MEGQDSQGPLWEVFIQTKPGAAFKHAGAVHAYDKEMAIENARDTYTRRHEGTSMWVVKAEEIIAVSPDEADAFFDPSDDKIYRHPTFYELPEGVKHI